MATVDVQQREKESTKLAAKLRSKQKQTPNAHQQKMDCIETFIALTSHQCPETKEKRGNFSSFFFTNKRRKQKKHEVKKESKSRFISCPHAHSLIIREAKRGKFEKRLGFMISILLFQKRGSTTKVVNVNTRRAPSFGFPSAEDMKRWQIPAFGDWEYCDEMPITQYFESARQAGLVRASFFEEDLFKVPVAVPVKSAYQGCRSRRKVSMGSNGGGEEKQCSKEKEQQRRKQGKVSRDLAEPQGRPTAAPKPVDEDLYKIPPELLCQKPKRKRLLRNLFTGCLGLSCIA